MTPTRQPASKWFNELPDDIKKVVLKDCTEEALKKEYYSLTSAVLLSFDWMTSKAGPLYYRRLHNELMHLDKKRDQLNLLIG